MVRHRSERKSGFGIFFTAPMTAPTASLSRISSSVAATSMRGAAVGRETKPILFVSVVEVLLAASFLQLDPPVHNHRDRRVEFFDWRYDEKALAIPGHIVAIRGHFRAVPAVETEQLVRDAD